MKTIPLKKRERCLGKGGKTLNTHTLVMYVKAAEKKFMQLFATMKSIGKSPVLENFPQPH